MRNVASPDERRKLYAGLGITLTYERRGVDGQIKDLVRPSLSPLESKVAPWSNCACAGGGLEKLLPSPRGTHRRSRAIATRGLSGRTRCRYPFRTDHPEDTPAPSTPELVLNVERETAIHVDMTEKSWREVGDVLLVEVNWPY